ncbi:MAG: PqqD family protein [Chloracidobacterium sp.]|nr:PqqD family protein [Chloracidobacterium sp.]MDW8217665.1 PqqD family protein [Acidobacteriota bacterium]
MVDFNSRATIPNHVIVRRVADEAVLLNLATEHYYALDSVGYAMLLQSTNGGTLADAVEALLDEYDVTRERLVEDFEELLNQLLEAGLIEIVPPLSVS